VALHEVIGLAGTKLDPKVVEAMKRCNADGALSGIFGLPDRCAVDS
jgi:hypothetical protein